MKRVLGSWIFWVVVLVVAGVAYHYFVVGGLKKAVATAQAEVERGVKLGNSAHERLDKAVELMTSLKGEVDSKATKAELKEATDKLANYEDLFALQKKVDAIDEKVNPLELVAESVDGPDGDKDKAVPPAESEAKTACLANLKQAGFTVEEAASECSSL